MHRNRRPALPPDKQCSRYEISLRCGRPHVWWSGACLGDFLFGLEEDLCIGFYRSPAAGIITCPNIAQQCSCYPYVAQQLLIGSSWSCCIVGKVVSRVWGICFNVRKDLASTLQFGKHNKETGAGIILIFIDFLTHAWGQRTACAAYSSSSFCDLLLPLSIFKSEEIQFPLFNLGSVSRRRVLNHTNFYRVFTHFSDGRCCGFVIFPLLWS